MRQRALPRIPSAWCALAFGTGTSGPATRNACGGRAEHRRRRDARADRCAAAAHSHPLERSALPTFAWRRGRECSGRAPLPKRECDEPPSRCTRAMRLSCRGTHADIHIRAPSFVPIPAPCCLTLRQSCFADVWPAAFARLTCRRALGAERSARANKRCDCKLAYRALSCQDDARGLAVDAAAAGGGPFRMRTLRANGGARGAARSISPFHAACGRAEERAGRINSIKWFGCNRPAFSALCGRSFSGRAPRAWAR